MDATSAKVPSPSFSWRFLTRRRLLLFTPIVLLVALAAGARYRVTQPDYRLARGEQAIQDGDWERTESYAGLLEASGHPDHAHLLRGEASRARRHPDLALAEFNKVRDAGSLRLRAATLSGLCLIELKNPAESARVLNYVIGEQPDNVEAHRGLAAIAYDLGQLGQAVHHLEEVARLDGEDARPHRLIGLIDKDLGRDEQAVEAYRSALARKLAPGTREEVRIELAAVLVRLAKFDEALEVLDADSPLKSDADATQVVVRAECLRGLNRNAEAAALLDRAPAAGADVFRVRGQLYLDADAYPDAIRSLERAVSIAPADDRTHFLLAKAYGGVGRTSDAARANSRAVELQKDLERMTKLSNEAMQKPWDAAIRLQLAEVAERLGKPQLAEMWRRAAAACDSKR